jgi:hypothetical protein
LSREPPFPSDQVIEAMSRQVSEMPVPIKIQKLPEGLESIMMRCLAKDAEQRYQTAAELNVALNMVASGSGSKLTVFLPSGTSSPVPLGTTMASNKPGRLILSVAVATLLLAGVAWFADQLNQSAQPVPERHYASLADMYRSGRPMSEVVAHCQNADELIDILSSLKSPTRAEKYMLADLYLQVTNVDAAAQAIESAPKEAKPSKHDPLKANIALLQGDLNTALKLCSEPVEAADGMSGVRTKLCLARVLLAQNKPDKALEVLRSIEDNTHDADPAADRKALTILANYQKTHNLPAWESGLATEPDMAPMDAMTRYDVRAVQNAYFFVPFHMRPRPPYIGNMQTY